VTCPAACIGALIDEVRLSMAGIEILSSVSRNENLLPIQEEAIFFLQAFAAALVRSRFLQFVR
jgi:hypothetical protein